MSVLLDREDRGPLFEWARDGAVREAHAVADVQRGELRRRAATDRAGAVLRGVVDDEPGGTVPDDVAQPVHQLADLGVVVLGTAGAADEAQRAVPDDQLGVVHLDSGPDRVNVSAIGAHLGVEHAPQVVILGAEFEELAPPDGRGHLAVADDDRLASSADLGYVDALAGMLIHAARALIG